MTEQSETSSTPKEEQSTTTSTTKQTEEEGKESLSKLQKSISEKNKQIDKLQASSNNYRENLNQISLNLEKAVSSYRNMVVKAHPDVPEELIDGQSVEEIDSSLEKAKKIVDRVKKSMEKNNTPENVPVGAPARGKEPITGLSAREKIHYAVGGNQ